MSRRLRVLIGVAALLGGLSAGRLWWSPDPAVSAGYAPASVPGADLAEAVELSGLFEPVSYMPRRDLFAAPTVPRPSRPTVPALPPEPLVAAAPERPGQEAEATGQEDHLAGVEWIGVALYGQTRHALVLRNGLPQVLSEGDRIGPRLVVEHIAADRVDLRDAHSAALQSIGINEP